MTFNRDEALDAVDALIAHALTVRKIIEHTEDPVTTEDPDDWRGPCPDDGDRPHDTVWVPAGTLGEPDAEQGTCRRCGRDFTRSGSE